MDDERPPAGEAQPRRQPASAGSLPNGYHPTAMPSKAARALAFGAIILSGFCGGVIGYAFVELQCSGDCSLLVGLGALVGALTGAIGVAVVATLALRAMAEWRDIQHRQDAG